MTSSKYSWFSSLSFLFYTSLFKVPLEIYEEHIITTTFYNVFFGCTGNKSELCLYLLLKMIHSKAFHTTCLLGVGSSYLSIPTGLNIEQPSPKFERASPKYEWASYSKHKSINSKSTRRPANNHLQISDNYHMPDLNSSIQLDEDSPDESPSSGFVTKCYLAWHKQEVARRMSSDACFPLPYGSKNGTIPGKVLNVGKEFFISY